MFRLFLSFNYKILHKKKKKKGMGISLVRSILIITVNSLGSATEFPYFCCRKKINWLD